MAGLAWGSPELRPRPAPPRHPARPGPASLAGRQVQDGAVSHLRPGQKSPCAPAFSPLVLRQPQAGRRTGGSDAPGDGDPLGGGAGVPAGPHGAEPRPRLHPTVPNEKHPVTGLGPPTVRLPCSEGMFAGGKLGGTNSETIPPAQLRVRADLRLQGGSDQSAFARRIRERTGLGSGPGFKVPSAGPRPGGPHKAHVGGASGWGALLGFLGHSCAAHTRRERAGSLPHRVRTLRKNSGAHSSWTVVYSPARARAPYSPAPPQPLPRPIHRASLAVLFQCVSLDCFFISFFKNNTL